MKRFSSIFIMLLLIKGMYLKAINYTYDADNVNVYQYSRCELDYNQTVPLFALGLCTHGLCYLTVEEYPAEKYYNDYIKSSEYPTRTYEAYYKNDGSGFLQKIVEDNKEYRFNYDERNGYLIGWQCFDLNTGRMIQERKIEYNGNGYIVKNQGEFYDIWGVRGNYTKDNTPFLNIEYANGYCLYFDVAINGTNRTKDVIIVENGRLEATGQWLREHAVKQWKKYPEANQNAMLRNLDLRNTFWSFIDERTYNTVKSFKKITGLPMVTFEECVSHSVRDNKWYEYQWKDPK